MNDSASLFSHFVSTRVTFRWLSVLIIASAAVAWIAVGFDIAEIRMFGRLGMGLVTANDRAAHLFIGKVVLISQGTMLVLTAIAFMTWLYRSRANLRAFGTRHLRYSRNWAVFGFLIPVLNLFRPYQVTREVWQASDPSTTDPFDWKEIATPRLIRAWWGTFIAFSTLKLLAAWMILSSAYDPLRLQLAQVVDLSADLMAATSVTLVYFVVDRITEAQEVKWSRLGPPPGS
ncbi:MAG: DUF4328 domain-containing protein [Deltaproteobacteria bacterium]|nr:DUF4328 domain-containing protein [Deltaproteobacteria bacterium]MBW2667287.1 DUF4328 domain-containing protein [Deltaproteobacteria bacterium]